MLPVERQRKIIEELNLNGRVLVNELVKLCRVSQETIRRDLSQLEKNGILQRSHGGAVINQRRQGNNNHNRTLYHENEATFRQRMNENEQQKCRSRNARSILSPSVTACCSTAVPPADFWRGSCPILN